MPTTYHKPVKDRSNNKWYVLEDKSDENKCCTLIEFPGEKAAFDFYQKKKNEVAKTFAS